MVPRDNGFPRPIVLDPQGNAYIVDSTEPGPNSSLYAYRFDRQSGWGPVAVLATMQSGLEWAKLLMDAEGYATLAWAFGSTDGGGLPPFKVSRYGRDGTWADITPSTPVAPGMHPVASGPHGTLAMLSVDGDVPSTSETLNALRFDPATGWTAPTALLSGREIGGADVAILADGTALALWDVQYSSCGHFYSLGIGGGGWTTTTLGSSCGSSGDLLADRSGAAIAYSTTGTGAVTVERYDQGTWGTVQSKNWGPSSDWSVAMGGGSSVSSVSGGPGMVYFSASSQQEIDLPPVPDSCSPPGWGPVVGMDAQGQVVAAWGSQCPGGQGAYWHDHAFYARFTPGAGWTTPTRIDGDEGPGMSGVVLGLGVNDSGQAMAVWMTIHDGGQDPTGLWLSPLP
jgi:hypothetical protein